MWNGLSNAEHLQVNAGYGLINCWITDWETETFGCTQLPVTQNYMSQHASFPTTILSDLFLLFPLLAVLLCRHIVTGAKWPHRSTLCLRSHGSACYIVLHVRSKQLMIRNTIAILIFNADDTCLAHLRPWICLVCIAICHHHISLETFSFLFIDSEEFWLPFGYH